MTKAGHRSGLEDRVAEQISAAGLPVHYEELTLLYQQPAKVRRYTPDFTIPNGIVIETKGRFTSEDRVKHRLVQSAHPDLDVRFVFSNPNSKLYKGSPTTYASWCERYGFKYAAKWIPVEWLKEKMEQKRIAALVRAQEAATA